MYKYSKISYTCRMLNIQKYNRNKRDITTLPLYGWNTASTHLNSKQSINIIQQNVSDLLGYYPVLLHVFTCTMCNGYVHNTCDISNLGLPTLLTHVCNRYIILHLFLLEYLFRSLNRMPNFKYRTSSLHCKGQFFIYTVTIYISHHSVYSLCKYKSN